MEEPRKILRDYSPKVAEATAITVPKGQSGNVSQARRYPTVGEVRGTSHSMGSPVAGGGSGSPYGTFCGTRVDGSDTYILGGLVRISNTKSITVPDFLIPGTANIRIFIEVNIVARRDDDENYFLSGIVSSPDTSLDMDSIAYASGWPTGTDPVLAGGAGVIILEVGIVTFVGSVPTFYPNGCGSFHLEHCGGNLTYRTRGM